MRDTELYRHLLSVGVALLLALGFAGLAQAAPGDLDPGFGTGGQVTTNFVSGSSNDYASALALQADGKIVVAGSSYGTLSVDFALVRYNPDGTLDTTFGNSGMVTTDFSASDDFANALTIQSDGKIVAVGYSYNGSDSDFALARYNADGSLDTTFGNSGMVTTDFGGSDEANALAIQTDGKIVVAGTGNYDFALARYNPDGSLDPTFGLGGTVTTDFGSMLGWDGSPDEANALALQANGKIVVGGTFYSDSSVNGLVLARYRANGLLDLTFSIDGVVSLNHTSGPEEFGGLALQDDGKILLAGSSALWRFRRTGRLDPTFGEDGMVVGSSGSLAIQSDGKILVASPASLARYNPDGSLDTSFGSDGTVAINFSTALALQSDGKIVVAGGAGDFALARYNTDGSLDTTFGSGGEVTTNFGAGSGYDSANALALQADGKIVVVGSSYNGTGPDFALARYNPDGSLDLTFGTGGMVITGLGGGFYGANALTIQADGKIVVTGGSSNDFALARYNPDGSLDTTFGTSGIVTTSFSSTSDDVAHALALQADGKIVVAGSTYNYADYTTNFALARYNPDGTLDTTFGNGGMVTTGFGSDYSSDEAHTLALQADGKIVVAGFADLDFALARYNPDGSLDPAFGNGGKVTTTFRGDSVDHANALALQADGKIVVAGSSQYSYRGDSDFALARYLGDAEEAEPVLSVSPRALSFGKVEVGTTVDKSFTVENTGGGALTGNATTAAPFSIVEGSSFSLGEGQSQEVVVRFSPSSKAFSLGTVSVDSDGGSAGVSLIGKGK